MCEKDIRVNYINGPYLFHYMSIWSPTF